jgi:hypothetical protein
VLASRRAERLSNPFNAIKFDGAWRQDYYTALKDKLSSSGGNVASDAVRNRSKRLFEPLCPSFGAIAYAEKE